MMISNQACRDGKNFKMVGKRSQMRKVWLPEQRLADMDQDGIDAAVMFGGGPLGTDNSELYIASFDAYNHWLWDFCGADRKRLVGVAYLPMRDVEETLVLLRQAAKLGFRTVNIPAFPQADDGISTSARVAAIASGQGSALTGDPATTKSYASPEFEPFWAEVADLDITVVAFPASGKAAFPGGHGDEQGRHGRAGGDRHLWRHLPAPPGLTLRDRRERRRLDVVDGRIYGPDVGEAALLDR